MTLLWPEMLWLMLAVPVVIGLSQMVVLGIGQMNLSVGVLTGYCAMVSAWMIE